MRLRHRFVWRSRFTYSAALSLLFICARGSSEPQAPSHLLVEDRIDPVGVGDPRPEFSWVAGDSTPNAVQSAYQILVASSEEKLNRDDADLWDSGHVRNSSVAYISYAGRPLHSRDRAYWKVRTANATGAWGPWSKPARFELGLLRDEDWKEARWIWAPNPGPEKQYFYFRKVVDVPDSEIRRARVYVSSVHHHLLHVDDQLFGKGQSHENPEYQYYQTFDVTHYLKRGSKQVFAARCHWFGGGQGRPASQPGFLFKAVVDFVDGSSMTVGSDGTWKSRRTEWLVQESERRRGLPGDRVGGIPAEYIDARLHPESWNLATYDDSEWKDVRIIGPQPTAPWTGPLIAQE
ncbi:MAG: alpha-L-rhamnosidase N-terminal domain-containing protein, partial [Planctomycetota bacterium]